MKILMISNHLGVQSGVQRYVQNLLLNLDLTRYQVNLFVGLCPPDRQIPMRGICTPEHGW